ncbi:UNVERIFIED_CONTAM: hypothetical protein KB574_09410 [Streptococcus canis]
MSKRTPLPRNLLIQDMMIQTGWSRQRVERTLSELSSQGLIKFSQYGMALEQVG